MWAEIKKEKNAPKMPFLLPLLPQRGAAHVERNCIMSQKWRFQTAIVKNILHILKCNNLQVMSLHLPLEHVYKYVIYIA